MDRETLIGAIEQRKRIAERSNQAFVDLPYEIVGEVLELLKEQEKALYELGQLLKERAEEIERLKTPTAGDNHIPHSYFVGLPPDCPKKEGNASETSCP